MSVKLLLDLISTQDFEFEVDPLGGLLTLATADINSQFDLSTLGGLMIIYPGAGEGPIENISLFIITANGDILWEEINAGAISENWTQVTHTGDNWTEINAGTSSETWTNKVV